MPPLKHIHPHELPRCPKCNRPLAASDAPCAFCTRSTKTIRRLLKLLIPYKWLLVFSIILHLLVVGTSLIPPILTKHLLDDVIIASNHAPLAKIVWAMIGVGLINVLLNIVGALVSAKIGTGIVADLRMKLHATLLRLEMQFFCRRTSGEYVGRIMHDTSDVQRFLVEGSSGFLVQILKMFGIAVMLLCLDWKLALLAFIPAPILFFCGGTFHKMMHELFLSLASKTSELNTHISETINGLRTIKAFAHEQRRATIFDKTASIVRDLRIKLEKRFLFFSSGMDYLMSVSTAIVCFAAALRIIKGDGLTLGDLGAFLAYITMFYGPIRWLTHVLNWMVNAHAAAERIFAIIDAPQEPISLESADFRQKVRGAISIKNVSFAYTPGHDVLKNLSLDIPQGKMTGFVGRSGVGKSTLINLICRFYKVDSGEITIDGINVNEINLAAYRKQIGMVLQEPFLFNATIFENIVCAKPEATQEEVERAARAAGAHDFIMAREKGYQTVVGEDGALLSGGEKQRIAIARAILHNPPILILDEATSSVDTETESEIRNALAELCKGRTVIAIAHRLSTLRNADRLVVIDSGQVAESGTHDELIAKNGIYARLVKAQTEMNAIHANRQAI